MATRIARMEPPAELAVVHLSGALGLGALGALEGNPRGSFHPLQSFPSPRGPEAFRRITIAVDATSPTLRRQLSALARKLGARPRHVDDSRRVLYHAAAVYASNYVNVVIAEAVAMFGRIGWSEGEATRALMPLVEGAVENIRTSRRWKTPIFIVCSAWSRSRSRKRRDSIPLRRSGPRGR